jgi:hypothetical protein
MRAVGIRKKWITNPQQLRDFLLKQKPFQILRGAMGMHMGRDDDTEGFNGVG